MSEEHRDWLLNTFPDYQSRVMRGDTVQVYLKAEMILNGDIAIKPRGCSCSNSSLKNQVDTKYKKWLLDEERLRQE